MSFQQKRKGSLNKRRSSIDHSSPSNAKPVRIKKIVRRDSVIKVFPNALLNPASVTDTNTTSLEARPEGFQTYLTSGTSQRTLMVDLFRNERSGAELAGPLKEDLVELESQGEGGKSPVSSIVVRIPTGDSDKARELVESLLKNLDDQSLTVQNEPTLVNLEGGVQGLVFDIGPRKGELSHGILPATIKDGGFLSDRPFQSALASKSIDSFVRTKDGRLEMSNSFQKAITLLEKNGQDGLMLKKVKEDLDKLILGAKPEGLENLQKFIDYQVYKTGEHDQTHDEEKWTDDISKSVLAKVPEVIKEHNELVSGVLDALESAFERNDKTALKRISGSTDSEVDAAIKEKAVNAEVKEDRLKGPEFQKLRRAAEEKATNSLLEVIKKEVGKHYMSEMRYTKPIPGLVARDTPQFIQKRLRFADTKESTFLFETKNGLTIAYDRTKFPDDESALKHHFGEVKPPDNKNIEFTPFDPAKMMIAQMQVPVMSRPITLEISMDGIPDLRIPIGKSPEEMGYQMTDEPAGVFRRSLNSQRVTEIQDFDDNGILASFQMKGAGVPAYGFDMVNAGNPEMGTFTGSEFFKLNAEQRSIGLRSFATEAFKNDRIAPKTLGMVLAADTENASSSGQRNGAISFRMDYSLGVRLENVLMANDKKPDTAINTMREKLNIKDAQMPQRQAEMLRLLARNLAITHLFGMQYDDSSMKDLADVGLSGEFSDSGTLRNLDPSTPAPVENTTFVSQGVRNMLGTDANEQFSGLYVEAMIGLLDELAQQDRTGAIGASMKQLKESIIDPTDRLIFLQELASSLGSTSGAPSDIQKGFYRDGMNGYLAGLAAGLSNKTKELDQFKAGRFVEGASLATETFQRLRFRDVSELKSVVEPSLKQLSEEAATAINAIYNALSPVLLEGTTARAKLEKTLDDAMRVAELNGRDDSDLESIHLRINALVAPLKQTMEEHKYRELSQRVTDAENKRLASSSRLVNTRVGIKRIERDLDPETVRLKLGNELYKAARGEASFRKTVAGLERSVAEAAFDSFLKTEIQKAAKNDVLLGSIEKRRVAFVRFADMVWQL